MTVWERVLGQPLLWISAQAGVCGDMSGEFARGASGEQAPPDRARLDTTGYARVAMVWR